MSSSTARDETLGALKGQDVGIHGLVINGGAQWHPACTRTHQRDQEDTSTNRSARARTLGGGRDKTTTKQQSGESGKPLRSACTQTQLSTNRRATAKSECESPRRALTHDDNREGHTHTRTHDHPCSTAFQYLVSPIVQSDIRTGACDPKTATAAHPPQHSSLFWSGGSGGRTPNDCPPPPIPMSHSIKLLLGTGAGQITDCRASCHCWRHLLHGDPTIPDHVTAGGTYCMGTQPSLTMSLLEAPTAWGPNHP